MKLVIPHPFENLILFRPSHIIGLESNLRI